ncbi:leucyl aminopeptidase [Candidatus Parcubacteria bacterium]|nr:leucyl aminopeptidase [Candidatus Parcubacteria bacterium]
MDIKLKDSQKIKLEKNRVLVLPYFEKQKIAQEFDKFKNVYSCLDQGEFRLAISEKTQEIIFFNLGEKEKYNQRKFILSIRKITRFLKDNKIKQSSIILEKIIPAEKDRKNLVRQISENIYLADYEFNKYKEKPKKGWFNIESIEIYLKDPQKYQEDLKQGEIIGKATNFTRDLANTPGGDMTPQKLTEITLNTFKDFENIETEIFDEKKLKELKMGGILGVSQGSPEKPRLIILKYFGKPKKESVKVDLAFVGKGVTFDSGGLNIKPGEAMAEMHMDMSGAAAVLGAILAISKIKLELNIIAIIPVVENMPSGQSYRPGDILKSYSGKTIEVLNTDAEGRIILADALAYAVKNFKPKIIIDVATLAGAALAALGQRAIALFVNKTEKEILLRKIGEESGDYVWPLPLWEEYEEEIKATFGDVANVGKTRYGGTITGALFLKNFIEDCPWVHLDISPTMVSIENQGLGKGATGTGVRYLIKLANDYKKL